jgi:hypothetical protein
MEKFLNDNDNKLIERLDECKSQYCKSGQLGNYLHL